MECEHAGGIAALGAFVLTPGVVTRRNSCIKFALGRCFVVAWGIKYVLEGNTDRRGAATMTNQEQSAFAAPCKTLRKHNDYHVIALDDGRWSVVGWGPVFYSSDRSAACLVANAINTSLITRDKVLAIVSGND